MEQVQLSAGMSPHIVNKMGSTRKIMLGVCIALLPTLVAAAVIYGPSVLLLTGVTAAACVAFEAMYCVIMKKPIPVGDFSAVVTGIILAFNLPPNFPLWMAIIGAFISIVIVKQLFGGIGFNFANPALVGRIVLQLSFTSQMVAYQYPATHGGVDALASATPLVVARTEQLPLIDLLLGTHGGVLGETCAITLIAGGLLLLFSRIIGPALPATYIGGVFALKFLLDFGSNASALGFSGAVSAIPTAAYDALAYILAGGLLLGAFFMATDYTTSPYTTKGKIIYGAGLAVLTVAMREWSNMAEGVSYSILLMNLLLPAINGASRTRPMGVNREMLRGRKGAER